MIMSLRTITIVLGSDSDRELATIRKFCAMHDIYCPDRDPKCPWITLRMPNAPYQRLCEELCGDGYKFELFHHATFIARSEVERNGAGRERPRSGLLV